MPPTLDARLEEGLSWRLCVAGRLVRTQADVRLAAEAPTGAQGVGVLVRLLELDGLTQAALARVQRVEPSSMCRMIDRLERDGLVRRSRDPDDRRATRVHLTAAGRAAGGRGRDGARALDDEIFGALSPNEREALADMLSRVLARLADASAGR
jgi:DNA-binding MarR family transcriptional regulator